MENQRAAGFSGGGANCVLQVGALLAELERNPSLDYLKLSGVSGGALNIVCLASSKRGELKKGACRAESLWRSIKGNRSIFKRRWLWLLEAYFAKGLYNTKPLKNLIRENLDLKIMKESQREIRIGSVELERGKYIEFTELELNLASCFMASSAVPVLFPPIKYHGRHFADGGIRQNVPKASFLAKGMKQIDLYLANTVNSLRNGLSRKIRSVLDVINGTLDATYGEIWQDDLLEYLDYKGVDIRIFAPKDPPWGSPFDFNPQKITSLLKIGKQITPVSLCDLLNQGA